MPDLVSDPTGYPAVQPLNDLECALLQAQARQLPIPELMTILLSSKVFVLIDKEIGPDGVWDKSIMPMVLETSDRMPVFVIFSAPERSAGWTERCSQFQFALLVDFKWLLMHAIAPGVGLIINPGLIMGLRMPPSGVDQLRVTVQAK